MVLKTTFNDGEILFEDLGDRFTLVSQQRSPDKFNDIRSRYKKGCPRDWGDCYAFICPLNVEGYIPLYPDFYYSVLSDNGSELTKLAINNL